MRMHLSPVVLVVLTVASLLHYGSATMNCIAYEPFSNPNYPHKIYDALYGDLEIIKNQGFPCIKTYYSEFYGVNAAEVAVNSGLKIVLGVRVEDSNLVETELKAAIHACNTWPDTVLGIYVGNENLPAADAAYLKGVVKRIKEQCSKPVGTVQTLGYWLDKGIVAWDFFHSLDWWGYNVYPFFSTHAGKSSIDSLRDQIGQLQGAYSDVFDRFYITETGWPSEGGASDQGNAATWENAKAYADGVAELLCSGEIGTPWMSYFIYNDPLYKKNVPEFERFFGVAGADGVPKWDLSKLSHCGGADRRDSWTHRQTSRQRRDSHLKASSHSSSSRHHKSRHNTRDHSQDLRLDYGTARGQDFGPGYPAARDQYSHNTRRDYRTSDASRIVAASHHRDAVRDGSWRDSRMRAMGGASKVQIFNACGFDVTADLLVPQFAGSEVVAAGQWKEIELNEGNLGWVWKLYINGQASRPLQYEFSYDQGKLWYDLSLIDSFGSDLEKHAMTLTCSDANCHPTPNCQYTRCPSAYNADGSMACTIYQVYYPVQKCCYDGEPSYSAAGGSTITLTLC